MTEPRTGMRVRVLATLVVVMFAALTTRLWFLQVLAAEQYLEDARDNAVRIVELPAPRGTIRDASGTEILVSNRPSLILTVNRDEAGEDKERILLELSELLGVPAAELGARLDDDRYYAFSPIPVAVDVPKRVAFYIKEHSRHFRGVDVLETPVRDYPLGSLAAHVLGNLGQVSPEKLERPTFADYEPGDLVGVAGVEAVYERDLAGQKGLVKYRVNSLGENLGQIGEQLPVPGNDVWLTIDADIQGYTEDALLGGIRYARTVWDEGSGRNLSANAGTALVIDPESGAIEAMASYPWFYPSVFTRSISNNEFARRFGQARGLPLLNRAIAGQYPPGSTYKPLVALSALRRDIASTGGTYSCPPSWTAPFDESNPEAIRYVFNNWTSANLGYMNLATALARSCDTVFYPMGYEYWRGFYPPPWDDGVEGNDDEPALESLQKDLRAGGLGQPTKVDLPYELGGRVPDSEWKRAIHEAYPDDFPDGDWFPGDFINMTIGQGDTLVTPLQLASAYAALQNDGTLCVPHVLDRVVSPDDIQLRRYKPRCDETLPFDPKDLRYVRDALTQTVIGNGTAAGAFAGFPFGSVWVAGKTGTAEVDPKQDFSWFAAMTEAFGEQHVVVVLVEQGGHGSTTAAPIARHIIEGLYGIGFSNFTDVAGTD
ncbi:MAG TPA: penicillin-binding protein 2 [Actinomycetota bacterium]|nr:penicillin-binding protein 2 [Actinomycetota bacterium]